MLEVQLFSRVSQTDNKAHTIFHASNSKPKVLDPITFLFITHFVKAAVNATVLVALALAFDYFETFPQTFAGILLLPNMRNHC